MKFLKQILSKSATVSTAAPKFLKSRINKNLRPVTIRGYRIFCEWLVEYYGDTPLKKLTTSEVRKLVDIKSRRTTQMVLTFLRWAQNENLLANSHEVKSLPAEAKQDHTPPIYLPVEDAHWFLKEVYPEWQPCFALALFAGIRPYETARMRIEDIDFEEHRIRIEAKVSKIRRYRLIETRDKKQPELGGIPELIWKWLEPLKTLDKTRLVTPVDEINDPTFGVDHLHPLLAERRAAAKRAGIKLGHDIFRHTFATYYVALVGNPALAARVLGHTDLGMLSRHYDGRGSREAAKKFFDPKFKP